MTATDTTVIRAQMEALTGHTPRPWHMNGPKAMEIVGRVHRVLNPENYPAAFVPAWDQPEAGGVDGKDEAIANARLIAAAPDMHATILALCDAQDSLCNALDEARADNERLGAAAATIRQQNARDTFESMVAMRDSINEHLPMPSLESDLAQGPDDSVFCAVMAEAVIGEVDRLRAENDRLRAALAWYGDHARLCRLTHSEGDAGRHALQTDGGNRARATLAAMEEQV